MECQVPTSDPVKLVAAHVALALRQADRLADPERLLSAQPSSPLPARLAALAACLSGW